MKNDTKAVPNYATLIEATFAALKCLGGSGKNNEINDKVAEILNLPDSVLSVSHLNSSMSEEITVALGREHCSRIMAR